MRGTTGAVRRGVTLLGVLVLGAGAAFGQASQGQQGQQSQKQNPPKPETAQQGQPLQLGKEEVLVAPVANAEEDTAYQVFMKAANGAGKIEAGEAFVQKYPQSRYCPAVYSGLTVQYFMGGQTDQTVNKTIEAGKKAIELNPNDMNAMAIVAQVMSRRQSGPDAEKDLDTVERYSRKLLDMVPTAIKPADVSDDDFNQTKSYLLAMAHSSLGFMYWRRQKYPDAVTELQAAVIDAKSADAVDFYLLGLADEKTSHYDAAAAAFTKCAEIPGPMQARCKPMIDQAKKLGATELGAPK